MLVLIPKIENCRGGGGKWDVKCSLSKFSEQRTGRGLCVVVIFISRIHACSVRLIWIFTRAAMG